MEIDNEAQCNEFQGINIDTAAKIISAEAIAKQRRNLFHFSSLEHDFFSNHFHFGYSWYYAPE